MLNKTEMTLALAKLEWNLTLRLESIAERTTKTQLQRMLELTLEELHTLQAAYSTTRPKAAPGTPATTEPSNAEKEKDGQIPLSPELSANGGQNA